ncbi:MAG: DMT family transporter [Magnetovibrio sp.]|nr:DMT family transporter [Magnetovibrio sp.]
MKPIEKRALGLSLFASVLVSTSFVVVSSIAPMMDSAVLTFLRFTLASILFAPIVYWKTGLPLPSLKDLGRYAIISAGLVGFFWGMFESLRTTTALNTATIFTLMPVMGAGLSVLFLGERLPKRSILALGLGMVGAVWVIFRGNLADLQSVELNDGDTIFFFATISMSIYSVSIKHLHRGEPMVQMTFWIMVTGSIWLAIVAAPKLPDVSWMALPIEIIWGLFYLAFVTTVITFFIFQWSTVVLGSTKVMSFTYLNPALVLVVGLFAGHALPPVLTYPGIILTVGATLVLQFAPSKQAKRNT